jgi:flagellar basal body-associated protein FliL
MVEPQLVDYIKKARQAGQTDDQTRALLYKNGWDEAEVREAILSVDQPNVQPKPQIEAKPEPKVDSFQNYQKEHQISGQPEIKIQQENVQPQQPTPIQSQSKYKPKQEAQFVQEKMPDNVGNTKLLIRILIILIILAIAGCGIFFAITKQQEIKNLYNNLFSYSPKIVTPITTTEPDVQETVETSIDELSTQIVSDIPEEYDATKITIAGFSNEGKTVVYCAPLKTNLTKISCFLNNQILFENPYTFKPYWVGFSPNNQRVIFLYYDGFKKQSFIFENGIEGVKHNGTITSPVFSDDSQNFAYMVMGNDSKNFVVINERPGMPYDKIHTIPEFTTDGKYVLYGARNGTNLFWVADKIQAEEIIIEEELINEPENITEESDS